MVEIGLQSSQVVVRVLEWYSMHKRDLPWRHTHDPYCILVSEVMLQQTQVSRVIEKYKEFLQAFPTEQDLAKAKTADVIRVWKGLGYNRRALFLQRTAQAVVEQYGGKFPQDVVLLKKLPGIGEYTARAVLCFALKKDVAVLDTNHRKFYSRVFGGGLNDKELLTEADNFIDAYVADLSVYDWNQALMDFMSAIERGDTDKTIEWFNNTYPAVESKKAKDTRTQKIPFKQTDRYIRGQIIDILREQKSTSTVLLQKKFLEFTKKRIEKVVLGLIKDGLILEKKGRILLP
jgi:A/G-specific adenine glycosylase